MSKTVYQYIVYCVTESQYVTYWGTEAPTVCPNNNTHTIDTNSIAVQETISENTIKANESNVGKLFQHTTIKIDVPSGTPGDVTTSNLSWPMDIDLWQTVFYPNNNNINDKVNITLAPNTTLGILTQNANISDTVLNVSSTVFGFKFLYRGLIVTLTDGVNTFDAGRIVAYDSTNSTVTVENALTMGFNPYTTYFQISIQIVRDKHFYQSNVPTSIGNKGFNSMPIQANTTIQLTYTNNDGAAKSLYIDMEYYYT